MLGYGRNRQIFAIAIAIAIAWTDNALLPLHLFRADSLLIGISSADSFCPYSLNHDDLDLLMIFDEV